MQRQKPVKREQVLYIHKNIGNGINEHNREKQKQEKQTGKKKRRDKTVTRQHTTATINIKGKNTQANVSTYFTQ